MELHVERHASVLGRDHHSIERIDAPLSVPHRANRRLALWGPRAFEVGNEQKATFVQENQVSTQSCSLFLYAARRTASSEQPPLRRADTSAARVSDNSSPSPATDTTRRWDDSAPGIPARLSWRCASRSIIRSGTRRLGLRALAPGPSASSARPRDKRDALEWNGHGYPLAPAGDRFAPSARPTPVWHRPSGRLPPRLCRAARGEWHGDAALLIEPLLLGVSCPPA
jgi:hypothetical protein